MAVPKGKKKISGSLEGVRRACVGQNAPCHPQLPRNDACQGLHCSRPLPHSPFSIRLKYFFLLYIETLLSPEFFQNSSSLFFDSHFLYSFGYVCNILKKIVIKKFARDRMSSLVKKNEQVLVGHTNILLTEWRKEKFGFLTVESENLSCVYEADVLN